jgi:hypothetical protein
MPIKAGDLSRRMRDKLRRQGVELPAGPAKYKNARCWVHPVTGAIEIGKTTGDGWVKCDSLKEGRRYLELLLLQRTRRIYDLRFQPEYQLHAWQNGNSVPVCKYRADFSYYDPTRGTVIEDVKSPFTRTAVYMLKKKWLKLEYGFDITEV